LSKLLGDAIRERRISGIPWVGYNTLKSPFLKKGLADKLRKGGKTVFLRHLYAKMIF
jgi:hypothetical protein